MPKPTFEPDLRALTSDCEPWSYLAVSGPNNCGKTLLLRRLVQEVGDGAVFMGADRYSHVTTLDRPGAGKNISRILSEQAAERSVNNDTFGIQLATLLTELSNAERDRVFWLCEELLGHKFALAHVDPRNDLSAWQVTIDGENLTVSSSGVRLLMTQLATLCSERFQNVFIDEPELGLSPALQVPLSRLLRERSQRAEFFPHVKRIVVATHSHLFVDRSVVSNNVIMNRIDGRVRWRRAKSLADLHQLHYGLLGNSLEDISLPGAIVLVEGPTDHLFLSRTFRAAMPDSAISLIEAKSDADIKEKVGLFSRMVGGLRTSAYATRLLVVLDSVHGGDIIDNLVKQGVPKCNIWVWKKNGIEHVYPARLLAAIFQCAEDEVATISLVGDRISKNGIDLSKRDLCDAVCQRLDSGTDHNSELAALIALIGRVASGGVEAPTEAG